MATREDLVKAIGKRYVVGRRVEKTLILDEFIAVTGLHRKHAMKLLRADAAVTQQDARGQRRQYGDAVRAALVVLWEAADRTAASVCNRWCRCWLRLWSAMATSSSTPPSVANC